MNYKFGGLSLSGESGPVPQGGNWRDDHVRLGGFVYSGQNADLDFVRRGLDLRVQIKDLDVVVGSALEAMTHLFLPYQKSPLVHIL